MGVLQAYQLDIMLFMSGICGILAFITLMADFLPRKRKSILALMELSAMLLLLFDRMAYLYRGDASDLGYYVVRFSNGLVFFLEVFVPLLVTQYLKELLREDAGVQATPRRLVACDLLFAAGTALIVVSQFTGLLYTFDGQNVYHRGPGFALCFVAPFLIVALQESVIIQYRKRLSRQLVGSLSLSLALPTVLSIVQGFYYGVSLANISLVFVVIVFYVYAITELGRSVKQARAREIEHYKEMQRREAVLFEQTAQALANSIDVKDRYTHGHSTRVALFSRQIAKKAGLSSEECDQVYFAGLLHDVGKIGIRDEVINKEGRLTDEEFEHIKLHPVLGDRILSNIKQSPSLRIGARYHHERYDGRGYPDGLAGEDIPRIARIIAVSDAYDAMTSTRSYRGALPPEVVREELVKGIGTQFDPTYANIMLGLIDTKTLVRIPV